MNMNDMSDIEKILWIEMRHGITKTISDTSNESVEATENELVNILTKYREQLNITMPVPRIRMWLTNDKLNFMFFERKSGKRILLGSWLANEEKPYER